MEYAAVGRLESKRLGGSFEAFRDFMLALPRTKTYQLDFSGRSDAHMTLSKRLVQGARSFLESRKCSIVQDCVT